MSSCESGSRRCLRCDFNGTHYLSPHRGRLECALVSSCLVLKDGIIANIRCTDGEDFCWFKGGDLAPWTGINDNNITCFDFELLSIHFNTAPAFNDEEHFFLLLLSVTRYSLSCLIIEIIEPKFTWPWVAPSA